MAAAAMVLALVLLTAGAAAVGAAVVGRHRAQAAADLAALSAAMRLVSGPAAACESAGSIAAALGAQVAGCTVDGLDVTVRVEVVVQAGRWTSGPAVAVARAGPATP